MFLQIPTKVASANLVRPVCYFTVRLNLLRACMHFVIDRLSVLLTNNILFLQFWWIDVLKFQKSLDSFDQTETQSTRTWVFKKQNRCQGEHFNNISERNLGPYNTPEKHISCPFMHTEYEHAIVNRKQSVNCGQSLNYRKHREWGRGMWQLFTESLWIMLFCWWLFLSLFSIYVLSMFVVSF